MYKLGRRFKTVPFDKLQTAPRQIWGQLDEKKLSRTQVESSNNFGSSLHVLFVISYGEIAFKGIFFTFSIEVSRLSKMRNSGKTLQSNRFCIHIQDNFAGDAGNSERTFERLLFSRESGYSTYSDCQKFQVYFLREIFQGWLWRGEWDTILLLWRTYVSWILYHLRTYHKKVYNFSFLARKSTAKRRTTWHSN